MMRRGQYTPPGIANMPTDEVLARTAFAEAGGEKNPLDAMRAVLNVMQNRAAMDNKKLYGGSDIRNVALKQSPKGTHQFSAWNRGDRAGENALKMSMDDPRMKQAMQAVQDVRGGWVQDPTHGATDYYNPHTAHPKWGGKLENVSNMGNHRFGNLYGTPSSNAPAPVRPGDQMMLNNHGGAGEMPQLTPSDLPSHNSIPSPQELPMRRYESSNVPLPPSRPQEPLSSAEYLTRNFGADNQAPRALPSLQNNPAVMRPMGPELQLSEPQGGPASVDTAMATPATNPSMGGGLSGVFANAQMSPQMAMMDGGMNPFGGGMGGDPFGGGVGDMGGGFSLDGLGGLLGAFG